MKRAPVLIGLCMRNLAAAIRSGQISPAVASDTLDQLAREVEDLEFVDPADPLQITPADAGRILAAIRNEDESA
jgi:hypothetical protein